MLEIFISILIPLSIVFYYLLCEIKSKIDENNQLINKNNKSINEIIKYNNKNKNYDYDYESDYNNTIKKIQKILIK